MGLSLCLIYMRLSPGFILLAKWVFRDFAGDLGFYFGFQRLSLWDAKQATDCSGPQIMSLKVDSWLRHALWTLPNSSSFHFVFCEIREGLRRP